MGYGQRQTGATAFHCCCCCCWRCCFSCDCCCCCCRNGFAIFTLLLLLRKGGSFAGRLQLELLRLLGLRLLQCIGIVLQKAGVLGLQQHRRPTTLRRYWWPLLWLWLRYWWRRLLLLLFSLMWQCLWQVLLLQDNNPR